MYIFFLLGAGVAESSAQAVVDYLWHKLCVPQHLRSESGLRSHPYRICRHPKTQRWAIAVWDGAVAQVLRNVDGSIDSLINVIEVGNRLAYLERPANRLYLAQPVPVRQILPANLIWYSKDDLVSRDPSWSILP